MIAAILFALLFATQGPAPSAPAATSDLAQEASLEYLCARYETLSDQMTADFLATQPSLEREAIVPDVGAQVAAASRYRQSRQALKEVVLELGTRECPADLDPEFPALL